MTEYKKGAANSTIENENTDLAPDSLRPQKLLEVASHCLDSGLYTDITFIVGGRRFPAHRLVMDSISDFFKSLFEIDKKESGDVTLSSISPADFCVILNFAYTGKVEINKENVQNILIAADYLQIQYLKDTCTDFIISHLDEDNVCDVLLFAKDFSLAELTKPTLNFLQENLDGVSQTPRFSSLDPDTLCQFLQDNDLILWHNKVLLKCVAREKLILNSVLRYISARGQLEDNHLENLISAVHLLELPQTIIDECLSSFDYIKDNKVVQKVIKLREKAVRCLNKRGRDNFSVKDIEIEVPDVPSAWLKPRRLLNHLISTRQKRYAAGGEFGRCTGLPISSINDPNNEIHRIDIWIRQLDGNFVVGGLKLSYRNSGVYKESTRGDCHSLSEHYFVELEPNEFIVKVIIGSGFLIEKLGFETNFGRICGPYGGLGGGKHTERAPQGSFSYLFDINCDSVTIQSSDAINNLILRWITFQ